VEDERSNDLLYDFCDSADKNTNRSSTRSVGAGPRSDANTTHDEQKSVYLKCGKHYSESSGKPRLQRVLHLHEKLGKVRTGIGSRRLRPDFEIHFVAAGITFFGNRSQDAEQICLVMLDSKTRVVLWVVSKPVRDAGFESNARKNFDRAMTSLVGNVKKLTTP
jgi:hypothetical protein